MSAKKGDNKIFNIVSIVVFLAAAVILTLVALPVLKHFNDAEAMSEYVQSLGVGGIVVMFFVQVAQIVVAFIPGEIVEFLSGTLYGWFWGLLFALAGVAVGETVVFCMVRILGKSFVEKVAGSEKLKKYKFLQDEKKLRRIIFVLFFIPGTPKDAITYIVPLTKIDLKSFLAISIVARIPSVVTSTIAGDSLVNGGIWTTLLIYAAIGVMSGLGILFYRHWERKHGEEKL